MSWLALVLIGFGVTDLAYSARRGLWLPPVVGAGAVEAGLVEPPVPQPAIVRTSSPAAARTRMLVILRSYARRRPMCGPPVMSSSAAAIGSGSDCDSVCNREASWSVVRAPSRGAVTPGASRTHSSATCAVLRPSPLAARATASTTAVDRASRYGSTNHAK